MVSGWCSAIAKQLAIDNSQFARIRGKLLDVYDNIDPKQAQKEYLLLRPFIIQNEFTTLDRIRKTFRRVKCLSIEEIGALYEECPENQNYWYCDRCGALTEKNGRLKGLKPSLCSNHRRNSSFVRKVEWQADLLQVKDGVRQRVCFPGIPEIDLYSFIKELQQEHPNYLREVSLYPAVDRYDLQLRFSDDAVWAIDFKDVRNPYRLAKNLGELHKEGSLRYDEGFYVISDRCLDARTCGVSKRLCLASYAERRVAPSSAKQTLRRSLCGSHRCIKNQSNYLKTARKYVAQYRALAVGKSAAELDIPTPEKIHDLIFAWARTWTEQFLKQKGNKDEIESVCDRFLDAVDVFPTDWHWKYIEPETLIDDVDAEKGLGFQAIPSLLATLLHEQTCTIVSENKKHEITWRKVQGGGSSKTGLHLVSRPFKATYIDDKENERVGYLAYRLDFHLQTQAGRFNSQNNLKPWIFSHLSCQRYAHEPLVEANAGRDISVLMGMNKARIDGCPIDSTD